MGIHKAFLLWTPRVCEFVEYLWHNGEPKAFASDCLSGIGHFIPAAKKHLVGGWRLHGSWTRAELPARAIRFTPVMVYALAQKAFEKGWEDLCVLMLLGFDRFARTAVNSLLRKSKTLFSIALFPRLFGLCPWQKVVIGWGRKSPWWSRMFGWSKPFGPTLRTCKMAILCGNLPPGVMRSRLKQLLVELSFPDGFQWYSLRRGGATQMFRSSNNLPHVGVVGRWNCQKTARIYITDALAQLAEIAAPTPVRQSWLLLARKARPNPFRFFFPPFWETVAKFVSGLLTPSLPKASPSGYLHACKSRRQDGVDTGVRVPNSARAGGGHPGDLLFWDLFHCVWVCHCVLFSGQVEHVMRPWACQ